MTCATCDDYRFVPGDGDVKVECPECRPPAAVVLPLPLPAQYSSDRIGRIRANVRPERPITNRAPVSFVRCPEHGTKIGRDGEGRLLGCCDGCAREYAKALRWMRDHPHARAAA